MTVSFRKQGLFLAALLCTSANVVPLVLSPSASATEAAVKFDIPAGDLGSVLTQIGSRSGASISFSPEQVGKLVSPAIIGTMTVRQAVARAIAGSGLRLTSNGGGALAIVAGGAPIGASGAALDIADIDVSGGNAAGTSDPVATENSQSYAASNSNISSKIPLSFKETTQSVSVVTDQQIKDQNLTTVTEAVDATPGLISTTGGGASSSNLDSAYFSRGFQITNVQVDGGSPLTFGYNSGTNFTSKLKPIIDLAEYDSLEVLRGSGGQYTGIGDPGGVLSLERKRPLDRERFSVDQTFGSFHDFRTVLDASARPMLDGKLRVRSVFVNEDNHYFYRFANKQFNQFYVNAELDLTPSTLLNFGGSYGSTRATPWFFGLPTYVGGAEINLPRDTCLCAPWARDYIKTHEYFLQATQKLGADWNVKFNSTAVMQDTKGTDLSFSTYSGIDPATGGGTSWTANDYSNKSDQYLADLSINGKVDIYGIKTEATVGSNYQHIDQASTQKPNVYAYQNSVSIFDYDGSQFPKPSAGQYFVSDYYTPSYKQDQVGVYGTLRISPFDWAHFTVGERLSKYAVDVDSVVYGTDYYNKINNTHLPIPNLALSFDLNKQMSIYGSYASIYQLNTLTTVSGALVPATIGGTYEAGIKRTDFDGALNSSLSYYYTEQTNVPVQDLSVQFDHANRLTGTICCFTEDGSKYVSKGIDVEVSGNIRPWWAVTASYNYNDNKQVPGQTQQITSTTLNYQFPRHIAKLFTTVKPHSGLAGLDYYLDRTQFGFGVNYKSSTSLAGMVFDFNTFTNQSFASYQKGYAVFDVMARYNFTKDVSAQLNVENLFDRSYYQTIGTFQGGNWYGQPLTIRGSLHAAL